MAIHTTTADRPESATSTRYTVEAAITEDRSASRPPAIAAHKASIGTPRRFVLANQRGIMPSLPIDHTMRVEAYRPEFEAESTAVSTTKFMMSPA